MTDVGNAAEAVLGLAFGGFLFIVVGGAISSTSLASPMFDFQIWGIIYLLTAIVLAVVTVYGAVYSVLN